MEYGSSFRNYYYALAASLIVHAAVLGALLMPVFPVVPSAQPLILVQLEAVVDNTQTVEKNVEQDVTPTPVETPTPPVVTEEPPPPPDKPVLEQKPPPKQPPRPQPPQPKPQPRVTTPVNLGDAKERDKARRLLTQEELERAELQQYVRLLSQRIETNLLYPAEARNAGLEGTAKVSFAIAADGSIQPDSLHIAASSGQPVLDAGALDTVRASVPFAVPPHPIAVAISIVFHRKS